MVLNRKGCTIMLNCLFHYSGTSLWDLGGYRLAVPLRCTSWEITGYCLQDSGLLFDGPVRSARRAKKFFDGFEALAGFSSSFRWHQAAWALHTGLGIKSFGVHFGHCITTIHTTIFFICQIICTSTHLSSCWD